MQLRRLVQGSTLYLFANLASRAVGFLMIPLYSRFLTPAEYGTVELIELTIQIVAMTVGLQSIGGAMIRIYYESTDARWRSNVISTALLGSAAGNVLLVAAGCLAASPIAVYVLRAPGSEALVRVSALAMLCSNLAEINLIYFRLRDRVEQCVAYALVQLAAAVALNIFFIAYMRMGAWGFVVGKLISSTIGCLYLLHRTLPETGMRWDRAAARKMLSFGGPLVITSLAFFAIHFGSRYFLSAFRGMTEVGTFSLAYRFAFIVSLVVGEPFGKVWNVSLYNYVSSPDWPDVFARVARYLTFVLCLVGLALSVFGDGLVHLMATPAYHAAGAVIPVLTAAYVLREVGDFFRNALYINKQSGLVGKIAFAAAIVNLSLNAALVGRYGMKGAAWATFASWLVYMALCWFAAAREHPIPFTWRPFLLAATTGLALYAAAVAMPSLHPVASAAVHVGLLGQFVVLLWLLDYFPLRERRAIRGKLALARAGLGGWTRRLGLGMNA